MNEVSPLGYSIGLIGPLILLAVLAVLIPRGLARVMPATLKAVGLNLLLSAMVLLVAGALIFLGLYTMRSPDIAAALAASPFWSAVWLLKKAVMGAVVWLPILALVGFGLAQDVEGAK